ncbi:MAG: hypothetical protein PHW73_10955 [Atribacterota bacterium]|nr:hypothetical protein [Atribacterota bacterium]
MKNKNKEKPKELFEKNNHLRRTDIYDDQSAKTLDKTEIIYQNMLNSMNEGVAFH